MQDTLALSGVLALDTAMGACAVGFLPPDGAEPVSRCVAMTHGHAAALLPMIEDVMTPFGFGAIGLVVVTMGPGSFTGIRTGVSAARGLALALGVPVVGATTLEALAGQALAEGAAQGCERLCVVVDSRREEIFYQNFDVASGAPLGDPVIAQPDEVDLGVAPERVCIAGDIAERLAGRGARIVDCVRAVNSLRLARLGADRFSEFSSKGAGIPLPAPFYLRAPDTSAPRDGRACAS